MTHLETVRYNEVIGLQIGAVKEVAGKLETGMDLEELEQVIAELELATTELKTSVAAFPHKQV